jgi:hypothetical protein
VLIQRLSVVDGDKKGASMIAQPEPAKKSPLAAAVGMAGIVIGAMMIVNLLLSLPTQGKAEVTTVYEAQAVAIEQQPALVNGRAVYTAPIVTGPTATILLQGIPAGAIAYPIHTFHNRGKLVSTALSWFRCADIVTASQYDGSQVEIELWTLLTEQERMELQAACSL